MMTSHIQYQFNKLVFRDDGYRLMPVGCVMLKLNFAVEYCLGKGVAL